MSWLPGRSAGQGTPARSQAVRRTRDMLPGAVVGGPRPRGMMTGAGYLITRPAMREVIQVSLVPLPEVRRMVAIAQQYIEGDVHFSHLVGPAGDCEWWARVHDVHPAIRALAAEWSLLADRVWNEYHQYPVSLPEAEFRQRVAADLGQVE